MWPKLPRISGGASGFGSQELSWQQPPNWKMAMQEVAFPPAARNAAGSVNPAAPSPPTRSRFRRERPCPVVMFRFMRLAPQWFSWNSLVLSNTRSRFS